MMRRSWIYYSLVCLVLSGPGIALAEASPAEAQRTAMSQARDALGTQDHDVAFAALERAVDAGFSDLARLIEAPEFTELRLWPGMSALLARSAAQRPRQVVARTPDAADLPLTTKDLIWNPASGRFEVTADLGATNALALLSPAEAVAPPEIALLKALHAAGRACGLGGVLYDNRDRGHSRFDHLTFPQLTRTVYDEALRARSLDYGLGNKLHFSAPTFGNSSTMYSGLTGRALPRYAMTYDGQAMQAFANYASNHIYVYPGGVDPFPANWPYSFASRGMSGSDKWILRAIALILASMPCDTRTFAQERDLIAPTVQMVFRRAQAGVVSREDYISGAAHPMVFDDGAANLIGMMQLANSLRPDDLPPMVRLDIAQDSFADQAGVLNLSERLFDTPSAIARVWRGYAGQHRMVVSAAGTQDPNGRDLEASFVLLRGDPARVRITPRGALEAEIVVDWHDDIPLNPDTSRRLDIGVFVNNGIHDSAPGFISILFPDHQSRRYTRGPGGVPRLISINYQTTRRFDPVLFWRADWQDIFGYDDAGRLVGWVRKTGDTRVNYLASGMRADGQATVYRLRQSGKALPVLEEVEKP